MRPLWHWSAKIKFQKYFVFQSLPWLWRPLLRWPNAERAEEGGENRFKQRRERGETYCTSRFKDNGEKIFFIWIQVDPVYVNLGAPGPPGPPGPIGVSSSSDPAAEDEEEEDDEDREIR